MHGKLQIFSVFLFALLLRWCVSYHPYSGEGKPPMFGDYEAQRHWQEITLNLPVENWYINSTDNDLQYWGLDYPPLTAYHSLLLGHIASSVNSSFVKLHESRGISSSSHKYFMRLTVLCADALTYIPAVIYFVTRVQIPRVTQSQNGFQFSRREILLATTLVYPGLILIDYGHFQYNCVSLGLFVGAVAAILKDSMIFGSILFVLALNYKQMELYHSLPFFFYILGKLKPSRTRSWPFSLYKLICVSCTVIITFYVIWMPFLRNWDLFTSVVRRLFPLARGVFEDKVANVWCVINIFFKFRDTFTNEQLAQICLVITSLPVLPSSIDLYLNPTREKFMISLINSALTFFLFSFQVHEKSILLVAVPVLLYFHNDSFPCFWFLLVSHFSMLPLYIKDDLYLAYAITMIFYFFFVIWIWYGQDEELSIQKQPVKRVVGRVKSKTKRQKGMSLSRFVNWLEQYSEFNLTGLYLYPHQSLNSLILFYGSVLGMLCLSICSIVIPPPIKYPDLFALLISVYSCLHFLIFYLYFNYKQLSMSKQKSSKAKSR